MPKKPKPASSKKKSANGTKKAGKQSPTVAPEATENPVRSLRGEVDRLFDSFEKGMGLWPQARKMFETEPFFEPFRRLDPFGPGTQMAADLSETDDAFRVTAELPGMSEENVDVTFSDGLLTIKGEKEEEAEKEEEDRHVSERRYGKFRRAFSLPQTVDPGAIEANMKNGVLTVVLPKLAEAKKEAKKISISKG